MQREATIVMEPQFDGDEYIGVSPIEVRSNDTFTQTETDAIFAAARKAPQNTDIEWPGLGRIRVTSRKAVQPASRGTPSLVTVQIL